MQGKPVAEQEIGKQLLQETAAYAESSVCRRKTLLHYFGEEYTEDNCGNCDNCLNPKKQVEAQELLCTVIEAILAVKENFKSDYIIDIIQGRETTEVSARRPGNLRYRHGRGRPHMELRHPPGFDCRLLEQGRGKLRLAEGYGCRPEVPEASQILQDYRGH